MSIAEEDRKLLDTLHQWGEQAMRASPLSGEMIVGMTIYEWGHVIALLGDFDTRLRALEERASAHKGSEQ